MQSNYSETQSFTGNNSPKSRNKKLSNKKVSMFTNDGLFYPGGSPQKEVSINVSLSSSPRK